MPDLAYVVVTLVFFAVAWGSGLGFELFGGGLAGDV